MAVSLNNLAALYYNQGKYAEAELRFRRALSIYEQQLGVDYPRTQGVQSKPAQHLVGLGPR